MHPLLPGLLLLAAAPRVSTVVVYPDRAQVTREVQIPCGPRAVATFEHLPPAATRESFRAKVDVGTVEGLRAEESPRDEAFAAQRSQLDAQLRQLDKDIAAQQDLKDRADNLTRVANQYSEVAVSLVNRELTAPKPDPKAWAAAFDAALATRLRAAAQATEADTRLRELHQQRLDVQRKQGRLVAASARDESRAEVQVSCPAGREVKVELSYLVGGASWTPGYEARADEAGGAVELSTFATVSQATGEDWSGARLMLSTAQPRQNATPPEVRQLRVGATKDTKKKVLVRREEYQEHAEGGEVEAEPTPEGGGLRAVAQGLSVQLQLPEPANVPGDGTPTRLFVGRTRMKSNFAYRSVPKLMPFVFRVADLSNTGAFPLLPGPLDAFGRTGFLARYQLERVPQGGKFHLTFGIEEGLRVKRQVVTELRKDAGLFGNARRYHYAYRFELGNFRARDEVVELSEHVPVSELDDVKVALEEKTTPGYELRAEDGIVTWKVKLAPKEQKTVDLLYRVDVPSSYEGGSP